MPVWLVGMMGSGKSVVAHHLAEILDVAMIDLDSFVAEAAGSTVAEIWQEGGEDVFRLLEQRAVEEVADLAEAVVATGGGVVLLPDNVEVMRHSGPVVWLEATPETLSMRITDTDSRPLLAGEPDTIDRLADILDERLLLYSSAAHHRIETDDKSPVDIANEIAAWLQSR